MPEAGRTSSARDARRARLGGVGQDFTGQSLVLEADREGSVEMFVDDDAGLRITHDCGGNRSVGHLEPECAGVAPDDLGQRANVLQRVEEEAAGDGQNRSRRLWIPSSTREKAPRSSMRILPPPSRHASDCGRHAWPDPTSASY